jgi:hypothetical protein
VNRHYQHRQRTLSDIHPNIAKNENIIEDMFNQLLSERNSSQCFRRNSELQNTLKNKSSSTSNHLSILKKKSCIPLNALYIWLSILNDLLSPFSCFRMMFLSKIYNKQM